MKSQFVQAVFDLDCEWQGLPPVYRILVNGELFAEREWRWHDCYLEEILQLQVVPGDYRVDLEAVGPNTARFRCNNHAIRQGSARWVGSNIIQVH